MKLLMAEIRFAIVRGLDRRSSYHMFEAILDQIDPTIELAALDLGGRVPLNCLFALFLQVSEATLP